MFSLALQHKVKTGAPKNIGGAGAENWKVSVVHLVKRLCDRKCVHVHQADINIWTGRVPHVEEDDEEVVMKQQGSWAQWIKVQETLAKR